MGQYSSPRHCVDNQQRGPGFRALQTAEGQINSAMGRTDAARPRSPPRAAAAAGKRPGTQMNSGSTAAGRRALATASNAWERFNNLAEKRERERT